MFVGDTSLRGSIDAQLQADTAIDGTTLHFTEGAASGDGGAFTRGGNAVDVEVILRSSKRR